MRQSTSTWRRLQGNDSPLARVSYSARFDGKAYPVDASSSRVTLRRIDAATIERTATGDRNSKETATWTLSADRQELTMATAGVDGAGAAYSRYRRSTRAGRDDCPEGRWRCSMPSWDGVQPHDSLRRARRGRRDRRGIAPAVSRRGGACFHVPCGSASTPYGRKASVAAASRRWPWPPPASSGSPPEPARGDGEPGVSLARTMNRSGAAPT